MPDGHTGFGVPVGAVVPTRRAIIPNAVGVDIGCGMTYWNTGINKSQFNIRELMMAIKDGVPFGEGKNRTRSDLWLSHERIKDSLDEMSNEYDQVMSEFKTSDPPLWKDAIIQLGTLGQGNHFLSAEEDEQGNLCILLHSGSRGLGAQVAKKFHYKAVALCRKYHTRLPTEELAFMPDDSPEGLEYIAWLNLAQKFAYNNRFLMMIVAQHYVREQVWQTNPTKDIINIHHNYAAIENHFGENVWVHRKGATLARNTTTGIIPGSMCTKSYIVKGKGNPESFNSCSHGAGRNFSRTEAKKRIAAGIDPPQHQQLANVELYGVREAHDELGSAYKDINVVMANQADLVDILTELKPVATLKG
jgi:tRNA-splicing ligase RtcB